MREPFALKSEPDSPTVFGCLRSTLSFVHLADAAGPRLPGGSVGAARVPAGALSKPPIPPSSMQIETHEAHAADDWVSTQGHPVLMAAKEGA